MTVMNRRILIVDDTPAIHDDYKKVLAPQKRSTAALDQLDSLVMGSSLLPSAAEATTFTIDSAYSGQEGLALVEKSAEEHEPYSVAFVDMRMVPGWNGLETIRRVWQVQPGLQVVLCTAYSDYSWKEIVDSLGDSGNFVVLRKPFESIEVIQLATALSQKWESSQQIQAHMEELDREVLIRTQQARFVSARLQEEMATRGQMDDIFSLAFRSTPIPTAIINTQRLSWEGVNRAFAVLSGHDIYAFQDRTPAVMSLLKDQPAAFLDMLTISGAVQGVECEFKNAKDELVPVRMFRAYFFHKEEKHAVVSLQVREVAEAV